MAFTLEVKYFNTFWAKKTVGANWTPNGASNYLNAPNFPGLPFYRFGNDNGVGSVPSNRYQNFWNSPVLGSVNPDIIGLPSTNAANWLIEESRVKGGYNNVSTDYGVKAYLVNKDYVSTVRDNKVIYSGLFNSATNVNETNVFSEATNITFTAPPEYGSIQRIYASDTKLHIFQQNKVSRALIDKDAIYAADGQGTPVSTTKLVIGEITPYVGEYGISDNPESFDHFGNRMYFSDKNRNTVLRLAENGLIEIAANGMKDFFRDELSEIDSNLRAFDVNDTIDGVQPPFPYTAGLSAGEPYIYKNLAGEGGEFFTNVEIGSRVLINGAETGCYVKAVDKVNARVQLTDFPPQDFGSNSDVIFRTFKKDYVIGAYDVYNDNYLISMQQANGDYQTLVYDEQAAGWVTFYDYKPLLAESLFNRFYTTSNGNLWIHNSENVSRNTFYANDPVTSSIEFIFNQQPSLVKTFKTIEYEGSSGWEVEKVESDQTGLVLSNLGSWQNETDNIALIKSYYEGEYIENGITKRAGFCRKENRYVANVVNNSPAKIGEVILGNQTSGVKGYYTTVKLRLDTTTAPGEMKELFSVGTEFVPSSY